MSSTAPATSPPAEIPHRRLAVDLFNGTWALMMLPSRTPDQEAAMLAGAHASLHHWSFVGGPQQSATGHWQIARVSGMVGLFDSALWHARRCAAIVESNRRPPFEQAFACEGLALKGDLAEARSEVERARALLKVIDDEEEREVIENDLATIPLGQ